MDFCSCFVTDKIWCFFFNVDQSEKSWKRKITLLKKRKKKTDAKSTPKSHCEDFIYSINIICVKHIQISIFSICFDYIEVNHQSNSLLTFFSYEI